MVIDRGDLVEYDTHENLMEQKGLYFHLYNQQKRGDTDEQYADGVRSEARQKA